VVATVVLVACAVGAVYLYGYVTTIGYTYKVSTYWFGPSLMLAAGRGFANPIAEKVPGLREFWDERSDRFDVGQIPARDCAREPSGLQRCYPYLLGTVAFFWWIFGVSWWAYRLFLVVLYGVTAGVAYGVFRLGMGRVTSALGTAVFMLSPAVLTIAPSSRDFSKAPFILAIVLLMGWLTRERAGRRAYWGVSALIGALAGVGLGFRDDVLVLLLPGVLAVGFVARGKPSLKVWERLPAVGVCLASFVVLASPMLFQMNAEGPRASHSIICGLAPKCDAVLGLERASYERVYYFGDAYTHATANSYGHRVLGVTDPIPYLTTASAVAKNQYVLELARRFPADMLARGYASTVRMLGGAFSRLPKDYPANGLTETTAVLLTPLGRHLERWKLVYAATALVILAAHSVPTASVALVVLLYATAYACLQFHLRHHFHLTIASLWLFAFVAERAVAAVLGLRDGEVRRQVAARLRTPGQWWGPRPARALAFAVGAALVLTVPVFAARAYQRREVDAYLLRCEDATLAPLESRAEPGDDGVAFTLVQPLESAKHTTGAQVWEAQTEYLMAEFAASEDVRTIRLLYDSETPFNDFSEDVVVDAAPQDGQGTTRYFFPVYQALYTSVAGTQNPFPGFDGRWGRSAFAGIRVPQEYAASFKGLHRVTDLEPFTVLLNVSISDDRSGFRYYQRIPLCSEESSGG